MGRVSRSTLRVLLAALLLGGAAAQQWGPFPDDAAAAIAEGTSLNPATTTSGLNLDPSTNGVGGFTGRVLTSSTATDASSLLHDTSDSAGWSDTFMVVNMTGVNQGIVGAVSLESRVTFNSMQNFLWLVATDGNEVYKIDTSLTGAASIVGTYASKPSASAGNPAAVAILSNGDAFVGNAYTFALDEIGSLTKIQAASDFCGNNGAPTTPGRTSSGLTALGWTSVTTGLVQTLNPLTGLLGAPTIGLVGSIADNLDQCVKRWDNLTAADANANQVSIAAIGADGADNVYTVAVNEQTRFEGYLKIYRTNADPVAAGSAVDLILDQYQDQFRIDGKDGPGAPGGSGLVFDKWGYLWTGGGTYNKSGHYVVLRVDVTTSLVQYFYLPHQTQAVALDNNSNLWVSGENGISLMNIDPAVIGLITAADTIGITTLLTPGNSFVNLLAIQGDCALDNCCEEGAYNSGIAVSRTTGDVYVANECSSGKVIHLDSTGAQVGAAIDIGTFPSSIQTAADDSVWVPILMTNALDTARTTQVKKILPGAANTVQDVYEIPTPYVGGIGDMTGRYSAQPPVQGSWEWVHDTWYPGYDKWGHGSDSGGSNAMARWVATNISLADNSDMTVAASTSDDGITWSASTDVGDTWTELNLPAGRFIRFVASFLRGNKIGPEIGPQAVGLFPLLTRFEIVPRNNPPTAICTDKTVNADIPTVQTDSTFGTGNLGNRLCGAALDTTTAVDLGSHDPDTAELDSIVSPLPTAAFYSPLQYTLQSTLQQFTTSTLSITDAHGANNTCQANVNIVDTQPPAWKHSSGELLPGVQATRPLTGALADIATKCIWPPNYKFFCWLDFLREDNDQLFPLYDNCAGGFPIGKQVDGFVCEDSDPRTQPGDCVVYEDTSSGSTVYNMCVKAQRRTVYSNKARVYQANIQVTDGSAQTIDVANTYSRRIKIPPLWQYQVSSECPRPTYKTPAGQSAKYVNAARK